MDKELLIVTIGFLLLMSVPGIVLGLDIKFTHGNIVYLPIGVMIVGGVCMIPIFRDNKQKLEKWR